MKLFRECAIWFGFALGLISLIQYFTAHGRIFWLYPSGYGATWGPFVNRDHYSVLLELLIPITLYRVWGTRRPAIYAGAVAIMFASGIADRSRAGAILTTALILAMMAIMFRRGRSDREPEVLLLTACAVIAMIAGWQRFIEPDLFKSRYEFFVAWVRMVSEHPWLGSGLGTWPYEYPAYAITSLRVFVNAAHDDWAQWAVEGGIGFPLLILSILFWSAGRSSRFPWSLGLVAMLLHCAVDFPMQVPALQLWFFAILGALCGSSGSEFGQQSTMVSRSLSRQTGAKSW